MREVHAEGACTPCNPDGGPEACGPIEGKGGASSRILLRPAVSASVSLLVMSTFVLLASISIASGYTCLENTESHDFPEFRLGHSPTTESHDTRNGFLGSVWECISYSPGAVLVAWSAGYHRRFRRDLMLHNLATAYVFMSALGTFLSASFPWLYKCHPGYLATSMHAANAMIWALCKSVTWMIIGTKLRDLGDMKISRIVIVGACSSVPVAPAGALLFYMPEVVGISDKILGWTNMIGVIWISVFSLLIGAGLSSLLVNARRAIRSDSRAQRRAALWLAVTAIAGALSICTTACNMILISFVSPSAIWGVTVLVDGVLDSLCLVVLTGLAGPPELRRLAQNAFTAIDCYRDDQMDQFYLEYLQYLDDARVMWVRASYLRQLASASRLMPRCQDVPTSEAFIGSAGFPLCKDEPKHRWAISHPWISKEHPDPHGLKLQLLCDQLDALGADDDDGIFLDYMSLPQHNLEDPDLVRLDREGKWPEPGTHAAVRTHEENANFEKALSAMELIYSMGHTPVVVLPMDECVDTGRGYAARGWCFLEFCLALAFGNVANAEMHAPVKRLCEQVRDQHAHTIEGFRAAFPEKQFTCSGDYRVVLRLFEQTLNKKPSRASELLA